MKKVFIVEDDKFLVRVSKTKLEDKQFEVEMYETGEKVVEAAKAQKPDAIILDLILPNKSGLSILDDLSKNSDSKTIVIIVLSVVPESELEKYRKDYPAATFLNKATNTFDQVIDTLREKLLETPKN